MRRFITILIIVLIFVGVILLGAWFFARHTAKQEGRIPPTFKEFLSRDAGTTPSTQNPGDLSSVFVDDNLTTTTPGQTSSGTSGTQVAVFTTTTSTPAQNNTPIGPGGAGSGNTGPGSGSGNNGTTTTTTTTVDPTTLPPATVPPAIPGPECSDADLNIRFTPQELARLQILQNRFYAISQSIRTDGDVATETGNHDNFKAKVDKVTALYNSCIAYSQNLPTNSQYRIRIPTPFWRADANLNADAEVFVAAMPGAYDGDIGGRGTWNGSTNGSIPIVPNNIPLGLRSLERSLRLNL